MNVDISEDDDESIFTTPDLNELWEDITAGVGYNHPDVLATTKEFGGFKNLSAEEEAKRLAENNLELSPRALRMKQKVLEIKRLHGRISEFEMEIEGI
jgi:hypothetical protein